ncbi:leucyl aminopeptidase [Nocardioides rotundus]|uniref:leucyl aminopeptidase n=1 Tax=Nocardioides rotundus TaxID=1774216 RepID=UPI001CBD63A9|nr:leucyl aminopeptidase [Nocardioides rotundus]UAL31194.1 leucyl aminopeptidase [Nocardioides rotundus]
MTTYTLRSASPAKTRADVVVVGVVSTTKGVELATGAEDVADAWGRRLRPLLSSLGVKGKTGEVLTVPTGGVLRAPLVVLAGLGAKDAVDPVAVRRAAGAAARSITNAASVAYALPADSPELVRAVAEGSRLGGYTFTPYKSSGGSEAPNDVVVLSPIARKKEAEQAFADAEAVAGAVAAARDWVNTPAADLTPEKFADSVAAQHKAAAKGRTKQLTLRVLDEQELADGGFGGILGVGRGSDAPPRLVELTWSPKDPQGHVALVGKGITFDSGGLSIKPAQGMTTMKCDMAGAAAVLQATFAVAALELPVKVSCYAPMAENMVSGNATRPGDVLTMYGGTTVEVLNTDAEGRLVLADALVRAGEDDPDVILDVATLTGAMMLALGDRVGGVLGTEEVVEEVLEAGRAAAEAQWPMPIPDEIVERTKASKIADVLQHDWNRWGGGLYAAAFLQAFTDGRPWAHLDIAGPAYNNGGAYGDVTPGGTGFAVATLVEFIRQRGADATA